MDPEIVAQFWSLVKRGAPDECWEWQGKRKPKGYGSTAGMRGVHGAMAASRLAYIIAYGSIPPKLQVCHSCDNPPCCNPSHLWLGTAADNARDRDHKGRHQGGAPGRRFNENHIREIRAAHASGVSIAQIAREWGVPYATISDIIKAHTYASVK